jgi:hypothetical protein
MQPEDNVGLLQGATARDKEHNSYSSIQEAEFIARMLDQPGTGRPIGLLLRTLHRCEIASKDEFRREQLRLLNHGAPAHIFAATDSPERVRYVARHAARITRCPIGLGHVDHERGDGLKRHEQQAILDRWQGESGRRISPVIPRHVSPTPFGRINFETLWNLFCRAIATGSSHRGALGARHRTAQHASESETF